MNFLQQGSSTAEQRFHNPHVSGSTPLPAPTSRKEEPGLLVEAGPVAVVARNATATRVG